MNWNENAGERHDLTSLTKHETIMADVIAGRGEDRCISLSDSEEICTVRRGDKGNTVLCIVYYCIMSL